MRKPRDFDTELKTLTAKAKRLREQKLHQFGELVTATQADTLPIEILAGALLAAVETGETAIKEGWRKRGAAFFQAAARNARGGATQKPGGTDAHNGNAQPPAARPGPQ